MRNLILKKSLSYYPSTDVIQLIAHGRTSIDFKNSFLFVTIKLDVSPNESDHTTTHPLFVTDTTFLEFSMYAESFSPLTFFCGKCISICLVSPFQLPKAIEF